MQAIFDLNMLRASYMLPGYLFCIGKKGYDVVYIYIYICWLFVICKAALFYKLTNVSPWNFRDWFANQISFWTQKRFWVGGIQNWFALQLSFSVVCVETNSPNNSSAPLAHHFGVFAAQFLHHWTKRRRFHTLPGFGSTHWGVWFQGSGTNPLDKSVMHLYPPRTQTGSNMLEPVRSQNWFREKLGPTCWN